MITVKYTVVNLRKWLIHSLKHSENPVALMKRFVMNDIAVIMNYLCDFIRDIIGNKILKC